MTVYCGCHGRATDECGSYLGAKQHVCHVLDSVASNAVEPADGSMSRQPQGQPVKTDLPLQDTAICVSYIIHELYNVYGIYDK